MYNIAMSEQKRTFDYYCLDRIQPLSEELIITYKEDESTIKKIYFKIALRAKVNRVDCFILYTSTDDDLDQFIFVPVEIFYDNYQRLLLSTISKDEYLSLIRRINTINIFEFLSLLDFVYIYADFLEFVTYNWVVLEMDRLIEV